MILFYKEGHSLIDIQTIIGLAKVTFTYHLQYVKNQPIREQNVDLWAHLDDEFAIKYTC
jgi:hypothetical protein